jgi:glutamate/aspartate transport system ATP-binding protein
MIQIDDVSKWYGGFQVLADCTTNVRRGEVVVVCGPSGSGKSTLIKCVNGLEPYQKGRIRVDGVDIGNSRTQLSKVRAGIGMVFQHFELYPHMNAIENIALAQRHVLNRSKEEAYARSHELLLRVGLADKEKAMPVDLSGGQQQRVAIARALALDPKAMMFDEPTSALDPEMIKEVLDVMVELAKEGMTMVVVTHEMGFARRVANRVLFMDRGRILEDAETDRFFDSPQTNRAREFLSKILAH